MTGTIDPEGEAFPAEKLRALFEAVEINDVVDPEVSLPDPIMLACTQEEMRRCARVILSRQKPDFKSSAFVIFDSLARYSWFAFMLCRIARPRKHGLVGEKNVCRNHSKA